MASPWCRRADTASSVRPSVTRHVCISKLTSITCSHMVGQQIKHPTCQQCWGTTNGSKPHYNTRKAPVQGIHLLVFTLPAPSACISARVAHPTATACVCQSGCFRYSVLLGAHRGRCVPEISPPLQCEGGNASPIFVSAV